MASPDEAIDALFGLPPEEFTRARDRLAGETADREAAKRIKGLRRPTVPAWAVNQTVRRHVDLFRKLLDAGRQVRAAQRRAASGLAAPAFAAAIAERRTLIRELTEAAARVLIEAERATETHLGAVANTFEAAAADDGAAEAVGAGRLSKELTPPAGFEILEGFQVVPGGAATTADEPGPVPEVARAERDAERWRTRLETAREERRSLEHDVAEAKRRAAEAEQELSRARRDVEAATAKLHRTARKADEAERKLEEAAARLEELRP
jgi:DNA repair exonuclease SbcCD ATPase subunit